MRTLTRIVAAGTLAAGLGTAAQAQETVTIAALYNLTGGMSSIDAPALNGALLHAQLINEAGGLLGGTVMLEVVGIDTKTDQQETATAAQQALSMDNLIAGIGFGDTTFVLAAAPAFQEAGIPFVTSGATHPMLPTWVGDHMFMTAFGDDDQSYAIADYAYDTLGLRRVALWTDDSMDFTRALATFFRERFEERGGEIVGADVFMMGDTDFSAQIARLQAIDPAPDGVFIAAIPGEAGLSVKQIREAGMAFPIVSGDGFDTELVATVPGPELANDVYFSSHTYRADDRQVVTDFVAAYEEEYGRPPENAFAPLGYDAVGLIANAIEAAGSTDPEAIRDALAATRDFDAVTGTISYTRESMVPPKPVAIIGVENGEFTLLETWTPGE
ncbi:MAG: ABC transporter substrate-binding protein [Rhodospirillaceae bacterium]|nr:ABC transporter substrate-binding protein [Rhodospirillaceae bacterium]